MGVAGEDMLTAPRASDMMGIQTEVNRVVAGVPAVDSDYGTGSPQLTIEKGGWVKDRLVDGKPKNWTEVVMEWVSWMSVVTI